MRTSLLPVLAVVAASLWACSDGGGGGLLGGDDGWGTGGGGSPGADGSVDPGPVDPGGGDAATPKPPPQGSDAGGATVDAGAKDAAALDAGACINAVASPGSGHHDPGQDCTSCHDNLGANRKWTVAGTLYTGAASNTPVSGATIEIIDATNKVIRLATYNNGNFYTTQAVTYPLRVRATKCPTNVPMNANVTSGSCNIGGCHEAGNRIHLP